MFSLELEDSDRLVNHVLGRLSKELDGFSWMIGQKNEAFSWISDLTSWCFFGFSKKGEVD